jgi:hypothetical protein
MPQRQMLNILRRLTTAETSTIASTTLNAAYNADNNTPMIMPNQDQAAELRLLSPSRFSRNYWQPGRRGQTIRTPPVSGCP